MLTRPRPTRTATGPDGEPGTRRSAAEGGGDRDYLWQLPNVTT
ncbi:hypothetical protein SUDANB99_01499 [Streptomyces sp. enrichment culture]